MSTGTSYDAGAPTIEVCVYEHGRLLTRELCESEEDAAAVVERWSDVPHTYVVVDDLSAKHGPDDILAPEPLFVGPDDDQPIASASLPGHGTE
jgi:hypothetical protein